MERAEKGKSIQWQVEQLQGLDMEMSKSFAIPRELTVDPMVHQRMKPTYATAKAGKISLRVRSGEAYSILSPIYAALPAETFAGQGLVKERIENRFYVDGGAEHALGRVRKAYPKQGAVVPNPVTEAEARYALDNTGIRIDHLPRHALAPYPLAAREDAPQAVSVNEKSENGFPVLGKWSDALARTKVLGLAVSVRQGITSAVRRGPRGVKEWKEDLEASQPWLVALKGKAKADYYPREKVEDGFLRFYNVMPRQIMLNMQVATQPLEALSRTILEGSATGIGLSLVRGNAGRLVEELERRVKERGNAYVHVGDDSWVIHEERGVYYMYALDGSNFDLTQHSDTTRAVHEAVRGQLMVIDAAAADLWYEYARERLVVVSGTLVRRWRHAGPSGMPLQSKVNDMLMDVLINRALAKWPSTEHEEGPWGDCLRKIGADMGFDLKVEQFVKVTARTLQEALEQVPFLFIGSYFHVLGGQVTVCTDVPRTLSQMPYPGLKWMKTEKELVVMEAMRMGSMLLSAGVPTHAFAPAFAAWRQGAIKLLTKVLETHGDVEDERLRWAVAESPFGPEVGLKPSLRGLLRAVERDERVLWMEPEKELPSESVLMPISWAAEAEEEEAREVASKERYVPPTAHILPKAIPIRRIPATTHPVTRANDGRPPPTAVWGPNKEPRRRLQDERGRTLKKRFGRVLPEEEESEVWSEEEVEEDHRDARNGWDGEDFEVTEGWTEFEPDELDRAHGWTRGQFV